MRLDEWQKYIDTQFLADETVSIEVPIEPVIVKPTVVESILVQPVSVNPAAVQQDVASPSFATIDPQVAQHALNNMLTVIVAPPPIPEIISTRNTPRIELLTPLPEPFEATPPPDTTTNPDSSKSSPEISNRTRRRSQNLFTKSPADAGTTSASDEAQELFRPLADMDAQIPTFQSYLPSSYAASRPVQIDNIQQLSLPPEVFEPEPIAAVKPDAVYADTQNPDATDELLTDYAAESDTAQEDWTAAKSIRRTPGSRAKNARNVRPDTTPSALSVTELWAQVPRHVQTLLSLERLEEKEVAQFSYKRQFQEKRHELIERLLDPILSLEDTARLLNVCPTTVRRYTNKGILTHYRKEPERTTRRLESGHLHNDSQSQSDKETRQRRFRLSDILTFLETQRSAIESDRRMELQSERRQQAPAHQESIPKSNQEIIQSFNKDMPHLEEPAPVTEKDI